MAEKFKTKDYPGTLGVGGRYKRKALTLYSPGKCWIGMCGDERPEEK